MYRALIVCNYRFPAALGSLRDLQGPKRDGLLLRDALTDHDTGMFERANVRDPVNDGTSGEILEAVEEFFDSAEPEDTLLFYYSGHGISLDQELFLCARNTDLSKLRSTAVPGRALKDIVGSSKSLARAKILVLDCCYSALFKGNDDREITELFGTGRYVLAATSAAERAADGGQKGMPSPFTKALADALLNQAVDSDGDGQVDLDDVYRYLKTVSFDGARPHQNFEGAGTIPIARRAVPAARDDPRPGQRDGAAEARAGNPHDGGPTGRDTFSAARDLYVTYRSAAPGLDVLYLDQPVVGVSFSPALVAEFRKGMRDDVRERMPDSLTDAQFLDRAGLLTRDGSITRAGLLLFGAHPTQVLPSAVVQCVRFHGTTRTAPREITDFHDPVPQLIARAYDFVAGVARTGDTPTESGPRAEPAYRYPMVAVREIIANAVVHRDYENQKSCVQVHAFEDRIEVYSPGAWQGAAVAPGAHPLGELARTSERRNFRIAQPLTWSRLMEGAGTGVARSVEECGKAGAQEPLVTIAEESVKVTIFPGAQPLSLESGRGARSLFEVAISPIGEPGRFRVDVVRSPAGEASAEVSLDTASLLAGREKFEQGVLASGVTRFRGLPVAGRVVRETGQALFTALVGTGEVAGLYRASTALAYSRDEELQIVLRVDSPELAGLPWEAMYDPADGVFVCRRHQLVRHVPAAIDHRPMAVRPPLRVLGVISSPGDQAPLDVAGEREQLTRSLADLVNQGLAELVWAPSTWDGLQQALMAGPWHVLHFIGHGDFDVAGDEGVLALTREDGQTDVVEASRFADLLRQARPMPRLVMLSSCSGATIGKSSLFSGTAAALAGNGVVAVTAMQYAVTDSAAQAFTRGFYPALAHGRPLDEAVSAGRLAIIGTSNQTLEWLTPVMYLRGHDAQLFAFPSPNAP